MHHQILLTVGTALAVTGTYISAAQAINLPQMYQKTVSILDPNILWTATGYCLIVWELGSKLF